MLGRLLSNRTSGVTNVSKRDRGLSHLRDFKVYSILCRLYAMLMEAMKKVSFKLAVRGLTLFQI